MKNILLYVIFISTFLLSEACQKDSDEFIPTGTTTITTVAKADTVWENETDLKVPVLGVSTPLLNIEKLIIQLNKPLIKDSISAEQGGKLDLTNEFSIEFPPNSCVSKNNQILYGKLNVEAYVLTTKGELISNDKSTISNGKLLISGGMVFLTAKQNGVEVKLGLNKTLKIRYNIKTTEGAFTLFEGRNINRLQYDWIPINSSLRDIVTTWADLTQAKKGYQLVCDRLGWLSCNKVSEETNLTNKFCVAFPENFTNVNTSVYVAFSDNLSVLKLEGNSTIKQFCIPQSFKGVTIGKKVSVISISNVGGNFYFEMQEITIGSINNLRFQPKIIGLEDIKKKISNL